jgi:hypothetical protein
LQAANLLIFFLKKLRQSCKFIRSESDPILHAGSQPLKRPPIKSLEALPQSHTLGDALDALIGTNSDGTPKYPSCADAFIGRYDALPFGRKLKAWISTEPLRTSPKTQ